MIYRLKKYMMIDNFVIIFGNGFENLKKAHFQNGHTRAHFILVV